MRFVWVVLDTQNRLLCNSHSGEKNNCNNTFHAGKLKAHLLITQAQVYCSADSTCILPWQTTYNEINICLWAHLVIITRRQELLLRLSLMLVFHISSDWPKQLFITTEMLSFWKLAKYFLNHRLDMSWEVW